ncbi:hypothetical protein Lal_00035411 [Lupinus albus]|nr:hypothetical protein Lal_00035407 [Lupinus albus]KAF1892963.1 hypothetical protein Lal_00035411 [Lupinus albus]
MNQLTSAQRSGIGRGRSQSSGLASNSEALENSDDEKWSAFDSTVMLNDLKLMFAIKEGIMLNWLLEILKTMSEIVYSSSRLLPYEIFLSRVIDYMGIDTYGVETMVLHHREHLVGDNLIHKMSIFKYGAFVKNQEDHNTTMDFDLSNNEEIEDEGEESICSI